MRFARQYSGETLREIERRRSELRRGKLALKGKPSGEVFAVGSNCGTDHSWVEFWTDLGELLVPIVYFLNTRALPGSSSVVMDADMAEVFEYAGSPERSIHGGLDQYYRQSQSEKERGRALLTAIVKTIDHLAQVSDSLIVGQPVSDSARPLGAKEVAASSQLIQTVRWVVLRRLAETLNITGDCVPKFSDRIPDGETIKQVWLRGMLDSGMPTESAPGILVLAQSVGREVSTESAITASFDDADPFAILTNQDVGLPPALAARFAAKSGFLVDYRSRMSETYGYDQTGIFDPGTTELDRLAFKYVFDRDRQQSLVVLAPTSSGKSRLGQLSVAAAIAQKRSAGQPGRVVVLVPTKALVKQMGRELREMFDADSTRDWKVLEGSRDFPQHDDHLRVGNFDVAICIPEKLAALMRIGMSLSQTPIVVVDEMQHLVDGSRGQQLELLMLDLFREYPRLRWLGLSASMAPATRELVDRWFAANGKTVVIYDAEYRPVPLEVFATDGRNHRSRSPFTTEYRGREIDALPSWKGAAQLVRTSKWKNTASNYEYLIRILVGLIESHKATEPESPLPSILVFLSSRRLAENVSGAFSVIASALDILPMADSDPISYVRGRFAAFEAQPEDEISPTPSELRDEFALLSPSRLRTRIQESIESGIGFHTASLDSNLRETVEDAFRRGYIRVLFATDTLKLGVNLPADIVVNGDFVLNAGGFQRLLDKDTVIQRLGRAGRLGLSKTHGTGVIAVSPEFVRNTYQSLEVNIDERRGLTGDSESTDSAVITAATKVDPVFYHYLADWDGGATYAVPISDEWLLDAVLRVVSEVPHLNIPADELRKRSLDTFERSLPGMLGGAAPLDVLQRLEEKGAIALDGDLARLTRVGRAAAMNAIGVAAAPLIETIAAAASAGAGPLTLLYEICLSEVAQKHRFTFQMQCDESTAEGTRKKIVGFAQRLLNKVRATDPHYFRLQNDQATDVCGSGKKADALRALILGATDIRTISVQQLTALWRAIVLTDWWSGRPVSRIETMIGGDSRVLADETDIRQLAEGIANLLSTVADYLGTAPADMTFRSLFVFAQELEIGLPMVLMSLVRTNERTMHRERLLGLLPLLLETSYRWDDIADLLGRYHSEAGGTPPGELGWSRLTPGVVDRISDHLSVQQQLLEEMSLRVSPLVQDLRVPLESTRTIGDLLQEVELGRGLDVLREILEAFGLQHEKLDAPERGFRVQLLGLPDTVKLLVATERINQDDIRAVVDGLRDETNALIIAISGATVGVLHHSRFIVDRCAVVEPNLFLEMIARVYHRFSPAVDEYDLDVNSSDVDIEAAARLLGRMLVNNAPVLTRSDLENRLRHDDLADPLEK